MIHSETVKKPKDAEGNALHEKDRVYAYDYPFSSRRIYGTLIISEHPETLGCWAVKFDDGEYSLVSDFNGIWSARLA